jgi:hypothetical protein
MTSEEKKIPKTKEILEIVELTIGSSAAPLQTFILLAGQIS